MVSTIDTALPRKDETSASLSSSVSSSALSSYADRDVDVEAPALQPTQSVRTTKSARSTASRRLDGTDPYENLGYALNPEASADPAGRESRDEGDDDSDGDAAIERIRTGLSAASAASRLPDFEVVFEEGDVDNPRNWPLWYRAWILFSIAYSCLVVVLYSTTYASSIPGLMEEFGYSNTITTLGMTTYLLGFATGSIFVAPMSELYGRQPVYMACLVAWAVLIVPSGLAQDLITILVSRFFCAFFGSVMITISAGSVVDISTPEYLAFTLSMWSIAPMNAPSIGGIVGGFVFQYLGWRWSNWIILIGGGVAIAMMCTCRETYHPIILQRKAAKLRKDLDDPRWWCQYDQKRSMWELLKINLSRPFILAVTEPILWFLNMWISLVYGVLYLCFVAYPIVFTQNRGWAPGIGGLAFVGMGAGTLIAIMAEPLIRRVIDAQPRDPETGQVPPEATALIMGVGAVLIPLGQLIFSWTCLPSSIHWIVPLLADVPFGIGNGLCFIYGSKYIAGAYGIYAASALAGNAVIRSIFGGTLPLAGPRMYNALTPQWAGTLLGLLEVIMIPIPFIFWRYGAKIRAKSRVIRQLREEQSRMDAKRVRANERRAAAVAAAAAAKEAGAMPMGETGRTGRDQAQEKKED